MKKHTLVSGATIISLSPGHGFKFSDGTTAEPQNEAFASKFNLSRQLRKVGELRGMPLNEIKLILTEEQQKLLADVCLLADIVIVPFPVLAAMREQGIRDKFPNAVAFNATQETMRSPPNEKIVDINNWSY